MTPREKEIFLRGFEVGLRVAEEFETGLPKADQDRSPVFKGKRVRRGSKGREWSEEEDSRLMSMHTDGMTSKEISKSLTGRTVAAINYRLYYKFKVSPNSSFKKKEQEYPSGIARLGQKLEDEQNQ